MSFHFKTQLAGAVEYSDCTFAEGQDPLSNECPEYDIKQSDGVAPALGLLEKVCNLTKIYLFIYAV